MLGGSADPGFDRTKIRLGLFGVIILALFIALFSRLWFLQVLATKDFEQLAEENKVRLIESDAARGRILDRNGKVLVDTRLSLSVTVDRELLDNPNQKKRVLGRLSQLLEIPVREFNDRIDDGTVSPYKPIAIANDVPMSAVKYIAEYPEDFPGVYTQRVYLRTFPQKKLAAHLLGYVGEITPDQLKEPYFKEARPRYDPGDIVGRTGLELTYDRYLRGQPRLKEVVVNSSGKVVPRSEKVRQPAEPGKDLILSLDARIQKITEKALAAGIFAARRGYVAPDGAAVVIDPRDGGVVASASFPSFDPGLLADGLSFKDVRKLHGDPATPLDDADQNRVIQATVNPGSTFKVATAGAAMATGTMGPFDTRDCPGSITFVDTTFDNWTSQNFGSIGVPKSLEISCDTFYYELGWEMERAWGPGGDGTNRFQDYLRTAGFGHPTGLDLPAEYAGLVPDEEWCASLARVDQGCFDGWLPGMAVNMSIGQGDLLATPLQMAVTYAAIANGGSVLRPHIGAALGEPDPETGEETVVREFETHENAKLPLDTTELGVIHQGLLDVITGAEGTGASAFAGFPLDRFPVAGKTGTAQYSATSDLNRAWFVSYAPADDPQYVVAVYLDQAGHGGESAAPVARQIYEGIFEIDKTVEAGSGTDVSD
jgi:penicillin-binding protein 2